MPILVENGPLEELSTNLGDPGLVYLESQKVYRQRYLPILRRALSFLANQKRGSEPRTNPKTYPHARKEKLSVDPALLSAPYYEIISGRRTRRVAKSNATLSFEALSTLLAASYGRRAGFRNTPDGDGGRTIAGPGGLYPLEIYFYSLNTKSLAPGLYHFDVAGSSLDFISEPKNRDSLSEILCDEPSATTAAESAGLVFITARFDQSRRKYGHRYLRFCMLEAGAAYQAMDYAASAMDLMLFPQGSFFESGVNSLLEIDGEYEAVLVGAIVGP